jgi:hypothetical protein
MRCQKNTATTFCLGCGRQVFCDLCQTFSHDGRKVDGYGPPGNLPVGYRDINGRGCAGPPGNFLVPEDLVGRGGFPGRYPKDFEFGTPTGFGGRMYRGFESQIPVDFAGRVSREFGAEEFNAKDRDL